MRIERKKEKKTRGPVFKKKKRIQKKSLLKGFARFHPSHMRRIVKGEKEKRTEKNGRH